MSSPSPRVLILMMATLFAAAIIVPLTTQTDWNGKFVKVRLHLCRAESPATSDQIDPWGNPYLVGSDGPYSAGPNGDDEGAGGDDVSCKTRPPRNPAEITGEVLLAASFVCVVALIWRIRARGASASSSAGV